MGTCFNGGCGSAGSTVGLKDLRHISTLNDCMILRFYMTYPGLTISQESFHCVLMGRVSEAVSPVVRGMEHHGERREARAARDAECATPRLLWPGWLASPLLQPPQHGRSLLHPGGCGGKATVSVSNAMKMHNNKELCI